jgi:TolB-like protein/DNA-binding winged helix-turn-helix (wHTH) protein
MRFLFGECTLDADTRELRRSGRVVHLEPQVFDVLVHLINRRDHVVSKDELVAKVWHGRIVSDSTLSSRITAARQAIGDNGEQQSFIRTIARRGFRFVGDLRDAPSTPGADASMPAPAPAIDRQQPIDGAHPHADDKGRRSPSPPELALPDKPSIAVLAFQNMSGDIEQEFFADGIAEEIVTALSKSHWLFVIARNSSFTYKGKSVDVRQVGRELGVRYVLEGSVRKAGNRVRITAQLIDATTGHHVWADRYDRALEDIFIVQDEITQSIIGAIAPGIVAAEIQRTRGRDAAELGQWERMVRAHWHARRFTREDCRETFRLLGEVLQRDPDNAMALADLAYNWHMGGSFGWIEEPIPVARGRMGEAARHAVACDDRDAAAQTSLALYELFSNQHDDAIKRLKRAIELDPNSSFARGNLGVAFAFGGEPDLALAALNEAKRLSPRDYLMVISHTASAWSHLSAERFAEAMDCAKQAIDFNPNFPDAHGVLAASAALLGRMADAKAGLDGYMGLLPGLTLDDPRLTRPFRRPEDRERFLSGLHKAGLPD